MLVKFFSNKQGGSISGINYLLNHRVKDKTAYVLKGDETITKNIVSNIAKKQKLCMGCLSFEEKNIDLSLKQTIIDEFETLMFGDYKDRYNILWVEHIDKERLELNFAIPKIDLITGLAFNPYYDKADRKLVDSWQNYANLRFNLSDPKDPSKAHMLQGPRKELKSIKDYIELEKILARKLINNEFNCRKDILKALKDSGIEITGIGKEYIRIKLPNSKRAKSFKGDMFHESFTDAASLEQLREKTRRRAKEFKDKRDGSNNLCTEQSDQGFTKRSYLFTDEFGSNDKREFRIIKFKQRLSARDKELNRLKENLDKQIRKRNNRLKEQSSREPKRNSNIPNIISNNIYSDGLYAGMELQSSFTKQISKTDKSKYENIHATKHKWRPTTIINDKTKIFTARMYHDTTRAGIIRGIRDKRKARERENGVIKRTTGRIKELKTNTILIARESKDIAGRIKESKARYGYAKFFSRAIWAIIDLFGESVANCYERSRELISRFNETQVKPRDITMLKKNKRYGKEECLDDKFGSMGV